MPKVRGGAAKWKQRSSAAQADYSAGIANPRRDWAEATAAAEESYMQGVQAAISSGRFGKGVRRSGSAKWAAQSKTLGAQRFAQGVQASGDNYQRGFDPYRQVIENINLPERGPKGDPRNIERVRLIDDALHAAKLTNTGV